MVTVNGQNFSSFNWLFRHIKWQTERSSCHFGKLFFDKKGFIFNDYKKIEDNVKPKKIKIDDTIIK